MRLKKRYLFILLIAAICIAGIILIPKKSGDKKKISVVTTIFPIYDWAREVGSGNENIEYTLLLNNGSDLHSFQPSVKDITKIASADIFIYVGGESDEWVRDTLRTVKNSHLVTLNLMESLSSRMLEEEVKEGMQEEEETEDDEAEEELEYDEHIWLSLTNAAMCVKEISRALSSFDVDNSEQYESNAMQYIQKLMALDSQYSEAVKDARNKTLVFADRFPFRYLVQDYGLDYFAAFSGCSAESEASFQTVRFLVNKIDELELDDVFVLESSDKKIARTVIDNSSRQNRDILVLDSMQSVSDKDVLEGRTYLGIMESNLVQLKKGL